MAAYLAKRILEGKLDYSKVMSVYGSFKPEIDIILSSEGRGDLITP